MPDYYIADPSEAIPYTYASSKEEAEKKLERYKEEGAKMASGEVIYDSQHFQNYQVLSLEDLKQAMRNKHLTPAELISEERFDEMLGALPPMNYRVEESVTSFMLSEFTTGSITNQYAMHKDGTCIVKPVDTQDRSTWITEKDFDDVRALNNNMSGVEVDTSQLDRLSAESREETSQKDGLRQG